MQRASMRHRRAACEVIAHGGGAPQRQHPLEQLEQRVAVGWGSCRAHWDNLLSGRSAEERHSDGPP